jgi:uncharacterized Tic20 family protein
MNPWANAVTSDPPKQRHQRIVDPDAPSGERSYATLIHLSPLAIHLSLVALPFIGSTIVLPVILWLIRRNDSPFLDDHGKEAVNFQISLALYALVSGVLVFCGIGVLLLVAVYVIGVIGCIMAAVAAHRGQFFRYPMTIRLI